MPSRSDREPVEHRNPLTRKRFLAVVVVAVVVLVPAAAWAVVINTGTYLIDEDVVVDEDVYVAANTVRIDGLIEGDLVAASSSVTVRGTVAGDLLVASQGTVEVAGTVTGSVRGVVRTLRVTGDVGDDVAVAAVTADVSGEVGRDLLVVGVRTEVAGTVGRDVRGRAVATVVSGEVGRDVDMTVRSMTVSGTAIVNGDVIARSATEPTVDAGATVGGQVVRLTSRSGFFVGLFLDLVTLVGVLALLAGGIVLLWIAPATSQHAIDAFSDRPWWTLLIGVGTVVAVPLVTVLLAVTLVGIPFAVMLTLLGFVGWFYAPVPALAAAGTWALRGWGGLFAGFVAAAVVWRLATHLLPWAGALLFLLGLTWGAGAWVSGMWAVRRHRRPAPSDE